MRRAPRFLPACASLACALCGASAEATPSIQVINSIPTGTSPLLQTPAGWASTDYSNVQTYDGDATKPWLIELQNQLTPDGGTASRVGTVGLVPTSEMTDLEFASTEAHPLAQFVGMSDSYVYRFDAKTGACVWKTFIGRTTATTINFPGCTGSVPASEIQCPNEVGGTLGFLSMTPSADALSSMASADWTVFAPTDYDEVSSGSDPTACGTTTGNRLYALNAATGAPSWVFNKNPSTTTPYALDASPTYAVAGVVGGSDADTYPDGCANSPNRLQVLFGTMDPGTETPGSQPTLFAISTATGTAGTPNWSAYEGDLQAAFAPAFGQATTCQHLYATTAADGLFETIGYSQAACGQAAVPCQISPPMSLFVLTPQQGDVYMLWGSNALFGKVVVSDQSTVYVLSDNGSSTSLYCSSQKLQATFPTMTSDAVALQQSVWFGATKTDGTNALVGLEIPLVAPVAPYDCGTSYAATTLPGTVGEIETDIDNATGARVIYDTVAGASESSVIVANFTE